MTKWFEDKFEEKRLKKYTHQRLKSNYFAKVFRKFSVTNWLIIINILAFIVSIFLITFLGEDFMVNLALQPNAFFAGTVWTLLTSMFMHGGMGHLLFNMISLFFIGNFVEKIIGRKKFFRFYIIAGLFAGLFYVTLAYFFGVTELGVKIFTSPDTFAVGASGAIFALLGLLAVLTPNSRVYLIMGPLIAIVVQSIFAQAYPTSTLLPLLDLFIIFYFIISIFSIFSFNPRLRKIAIPMEMPFWFLPFVAIIPLVVIGLFYPLPIGNTAHFGGLVAGLMYAWMLKKKYPNKVRQLSVMFGG